MSRHSGAKSAVVTVRQDDGSLFLSVEDDGCGFDPERTRGLGMLGMEERVRQLGGQFEIRSAPGKGTALRVTLPIPVAVGQDLLLNDPFPDGVENQLRHAVKIQLLENVAAVRIHRVDAQMKEVGDFLVGPAFRKQLQDLAFARGQKIVAILDVLVPYLANIIFKQHLADHRAEERFSVGNRSHGSNQIRLRRVLQNVRAGAGFQGPEDVAFIRVHAENHDLRLRFLGGDLLRSLDPIELRHADIENRNIRMMLWRPARRLPVHRSLPLPL